MCYDSAWAMPPPESLSFCLLHPENPVFAPSQQLLFWNLPPITGNSFRTDLGLLVISGGFPGGSEVKASAWNAGDRVWSLGREDPLEKEMATHSSILVWRIPWREEPVRLLVHGVAKSRTFWGSNTSRLLCMKIHSAFLCFTELRYEMLSAVIFLCRRLISVNGLYKDFARVQEELCGLKGCVTTSMLRNQASFPLLS